MITCDELVSRLASLQLMSDAELSYLCRQRSDNWVGMLDELQLRHPEHKDAIGQIWADSFRVAYVDIEKTLTDPSVVGRLDFDYCLKEEVMAFCEFEGVVTLAMSHLENSFVENQVRDQLKTEVSVVFAFPSQIADMIEMTYQSQDRLKGLIAQSSIHELSGKGGLLSVDQMLKLAGSEYIVQFVRGLILLALSERASDIHIEPADEGVRIRFRIDGALQDRFLLDAAVAAPVISRLKIMADLDIADHRMPQDGHIEISLRQDRLDIRFSSVPSVYGEKIVLRLLGRSKVRSVPDFDQLFFSASVYRDLRRVERAPNGIFLVTGPTGCGKTTTLYALLKRIIRPDVNVLTVEDPVEYRLKGATQVQINPKTGLDFSHVLRAFLRQDPDVILVGEIRDAESGRIATQAALTGHLVLATLHSNCALQSMTRLIDIGVEPYLVAPSLIAVMSQRLVRQICSSCRTAYAAPAEVADACFTNCEGEDVRFWKGEGCERCGHTGYLGRLAVHELFVVNQECRELISRNTSQAEIQAAAKRAGFRTMWYDGLKKALRGLTTLEQLESISYLEPD